LASPCGISDTSDKLLASVIETDEEFDDVVVAIADECPEFYIRIWKKKKVAEELIQNLNGRHSVPRIVTDTDKSIVCFRYRLIDIFTSYRSGTNELFLVRA
jgi:hypothetical protein